VSGKPEVDQPEVSGRVANDVLRLHVSVNDLDGFGCNERLRDVQRQPKEARNVERSSCQTLAQSLAGNALLSEPEAVSDRSLNRSMVQDSGHTDGLNLRDREKLAPGAFYVRGRVHELQYDVAVVWVQSGEDVFLAALEKGPDALEVRELPREPGRRDLCAPVHFGTPFTS